MPIRVKLERPAGVDTRCHHCTTLCLATGKSHPVWSHSMLKCHNIPIFCIGTVVVHTSDSASEHYQFKNCWCLLRLLIVQFSFHFLLFPPSQVLSGLTCVTSHWCGYRRSFSPLSHPHWQTSHLLSVSLSHGLDQCMMRRWESHYYSFSPDDQTIFITSQLKHCVLGSVEGLRQHEHSP